jgi:hypothetical protein
MPRATANLDEKIHKELKSLPEGFVDIKRLSYGEKLFRRQMVSKMRVEGSKSKDFAGEMQLISELATQYDFAHCIVDHNLEDEAGVKLNMANVQHVKSLDPRIGEEIDKYINELNNFEDEDDDSPN